MEGGFEGSEERVEGDFEVYYVRGSRLYYVGIEDCILGRHFSRRRMYLDIAIRTIARTLDEVRQFQVGQTQTLHTPILGFLALVLP